MHAPTIMLERSKLEGLDELLSARGRWQVAYRSWRAQQRDPAFPNGDALLWTWRPEEASDARTG